MEVACWLMRNVAITRVSLTGQHNLYSETREFIRPKTACAAAEDIFTVRQAVDYLFSKINTH